ncbi:hypothetical protein QAD02_005411 [Eretmocerus hayati]|uniref:Uncharacterized protein n=1 Tax=Eretmocerus hayati TaxID=131215 RepID=A0ACC2NV24_9HYME|nr:hypothetical protein QAD02_005411 [Eretmocerus hayati]
MAPKAPGTEPGVIFCSEDAAAGETKRSLMLFGKYISSRFLIIVPGMQQQARQQVPNAAVGIHQQQIPHDVIPGMQQQAKQQAPNVNPAKEQTCFRSGGEPRVNAKPGRRTLIDRILDNNEPADATYGENFGDNDANQVPVEIFITLHIDTLEEVLQMCKDTMSSEYIERLLEESVRLGTHCSHEIQTLTDSQDNECDSWTFIADPL